MFLPRISRTVLAKNIYLRFVARRDEEIGEIGQVHAMVNLDLLVVQELSIVGPVLEKFFKMIRRIMKVSTSQ